MHVRNRRAQGGVVNASFGGQAHDVRAILTSRNGQVHITKSNFFSNDHDRDGDVTTIPNATHAVLDSDKIIAKVLRNKGGRPQTTPLRPRQNYGGGAAKKDTFHLVVKSIRGRGGTNILPYPSLKNAVLIQWMCPSSKKLLIVVQEDAQYKYFFWHPTTAQSEEPLVHRYTTPIFTGGEDETVLTNFIESSDGEQNLLGSNKGFLLFSSKKHDNVTPLVVEQIDAEAATFLDSGRSNPMLVKANYVRPFFAVEVSELVPPNSDDTSRELETPLEFNIGVAGYEGRPKYLHFPPGQGTVGFLLTGHMLCGIEIDLSLQQLKVLFMKDLDSDYRITNSAVCIGSTIYALAFSTKTRDAYLCTLKVDTSPNESSVGGNHSTISNENQTLITSSSTEGVEHPNGQRSEATRTHTNNRRQLDPQGEKANTPDSLRKPDPPPKDEGNVSDEATPGSSGSLVGVASSPAAVSTLSHPTVAAASSASVAAAAASASINETYSETLDFSMEQFVPRDVSEEEQLRIAIEASKYAQEENHGGKLSPQPQKQDNEDLPPDLSLSSIENKSSCAGSPKSADPIAGSTDDARVAGTGGVGGDLVNSPQLSTSGRSMSRRVPLIASASDSRSEANGLTNDIVLDAGGTPIRNPLVEGGLLPYDSSPSSAAANTDNEMSGPSAESPQSVESPGVRNFNRGTPQDRIANLMFSPLSASPEEGLRIPKLDHSQSINRNLPLTPSSNSNDGVSSSRSSDYNGGDSMPEDDADSDSETTASDKLIRPSEDEDDDDDDDEMGGGQAAAASPTGGVGFVVDDLGTNRSSSTAPPVVLPVQVQNDEDDFEAEFELEESEEEIGVATERILGLVDELFHEFNSNDRVDQSYIQAGLIEETQEYVAGQLRIQREYLGVEREDLIRRRVEQLVRGNNDGVEDDGVGDEVAQNERDAGSIVNDSITNRSSSSTVNPTDNQIIDVVERLCQEADDSTTIRDILCLVANHFGFKDKNALGKRRRKMIKDYLYARAGASSDEGSEEESDAATEQASIHSLVGMQQPLVGNNDGVEDELADRNDHPGNVPRGGQYERDAISALSSSSAFSLHSSAEDEQDDEVAEGRRARPVVRRVQNNEDEGEAEFEVEESEEESDDATDNSDGNEDVPNRQVPVVAGRARVGQVVYNRPWDGPNEGGPGWRVERRRYTYTRGDRNVYATVYYPPEGTPIFQTRTAALEHIRNPRLQMVVESDVPWEGHPGWSVQRRRYPNGQLVSCYVGPGGSPVIRGSEQRAQVRYDEICERMNRG